MEAFGLAGRITNVAASKHPEWMMANSITQTDADLLRLTMAGDDQAFTALYRRHQGQVYRFALLMSGSVGIAEDVTQEVFLMLIREAPRYDPARGQLSSFLYGVARNYVLRCIERDRSYVPLIDESEEDGAVPVAQLIDRDDPLGNLTRNEVIRLVRQAVVALPARYREAVVLCDFQELSYAEAAKVLGCPVGTVSSRLHRGHALLLEKLRAVKKSDSTLHEPSPLRCFA
ncbi:MAG TPA: sigma-70 family RNA polymerase sigma factor [Blastocatellia bacterium]|nr:sigma-70 family RNA polymerase sigma factor [Blastocatellia bacterium]